MRTKMTIVKNTTDAEKERLWTLTMQNIQRIGNKRYVFIPLELLFIDERFQRNGVSVERKINDLVKHWDENKLEALKVSLHEEERRGSVIDGSHRFGAGKILGLDGFVCEILNDMPTDPNERLKEEARLFATQSDEIDTLSPIECHNANVIREVPEVVALDEILKEYNIPLKSQAGGGKVKLGFLAGYTEAVKIAKRSGKEVLENVIKIICSARWNLSWGGFRGDILRSLEVVLTLHPDHTKEIMEETIKYFTPIKPTKFISQGMVFYPERGSKDRLVLVLEDYLCDTIGMERLYLKNLKNLERVPATKIKIA